MQTFVLVDNKVELAEAWKTQFSEYSNFEIHGGVDIFDYTGDAVVSPANSFGFMDGGIDLLYSLNMGWHVQKRLQDDIAINYHGELLVGQATMVHTDYKKFPYLICAPTMRVPKRLSGTPNVYLAAKALFIFAKSHPALERIICPGLGTGTGKVSPEECAAMMKRAYQDAYLSSYTIPKNLYEANVRNSMEITI